LADVFLSEFELTARRALSMWNRDPASPSRGSFDRAYWGWKAKDFSDATLQYAAKLVIGYARLNGEFRQSAALGAWLEEYVAYCCRAQQPDGSFDQCYPHERTPGVVYDMLSALLEVHDSECLASARARAALEEVMVRAVAFALSEDERHGEIANHLASYAFELLNYGRARGDAAATSRGMQYLDRLLALFDRDEGWFLEYQGPDAGYQTRTLRYLAKCAELIGDSALWDTAERAGQFLEQVLMPDGSVHPMLGTRSTALVYPSGFMRLAARSPRFASVAALVHEGWSRARVPLPSTLDFDNAIRLAEDAREAAAIGVPPVRAVESAAVAPRVDLPRAGLTVWRTPSRAVFVASRLGGVVVVYDRAHDGTWQLRREDSGYLVARADGSRWLSRFPGAGTLVTSAGARLVIRTRFARSLHEELTPARLVLLRVLNATVLRIQWVADLFRRLVVRRLMSRVDWLGLEIEREVTMEAHGLQIRDRLVGSWRDARAQLFRCRRVTGTHMATARYFQPQELELDAAWCAPVEWPSGELLADETMQGVETSTMAAGKVTA